MKSMTYGNLPKWAVFKKHFKAEVPDGIYTATFRGSDLKVIKKIGYDSELAMSDAETYGLVEILTALCLSSPDEDLGDTAGSIASSILYTLGFEWI